MVRDKWGIKERFALERRFLGMLWLEPEWLLDVPDFSYDYWTDETHRRLFELIYETIAIDRQDKMVLYRRALAERSFWDDYANKEIIPHKKQFFSLAESLKEWHKKLKLRDIFEGALSHLSNGVPCDTVLADTLDELSAFAYAGGASHFAPSEALGEVAIDLASEGYVGRLIPLGISEEADAEGLIGLHRREITLLTGRTGRGKTTIALNVTYQLLKRGYAVIYYSTEMPAVALYTRLLAIHNRLPWHVLYGIHADADVVSGAVEDFNKMLASSGGALVIVDHPMMDWLTIEAAAQRAKVIWGRKVDVAVIDYVQQVMSPRQYDNRAAELQALSSWLHTFARQHDAALLVVAQVNEKEEVRECRVFAHDAALYMHIQESQLTDFQNNTAQITLLLKKVRYLGVTTKWQCELDITTGILTPLSVEKAIAPQEAPGGEEGDEEGDEKASKEDSKVAADDEQVYDVPFVAQTLDVQHNEGNSGNFSEESLREYEEHSEVSDPPF